MIDTTFELAMNRRTLMGLAAGAAILSASGARAAADSENGAPAAPSDVWDKIFPENNQVRHRKVTFPNRYGITLTGELYTPKNAQGLLPAVALCGPFGAVKEQVSGLYAQELAARGFAALAFDASWTGESGGMPRNMASPEVNTEDFSAAVDFLTTCPEADAEKIGIVGICGFAGFGLNAAAMDTRIKGSVIVTMYDMTRVNARGYFDAMTEDDRYALRQALNAQRTVDARLGTTTPGAPGLPEKLTGEEPKFVQDYFDFYKTKRGFHPRSVASNGAWTATMAVSFITMPILAYSDEIRSAVLMIHGEKAHSRYFSEDAFKKLRGANKELMIIPGASHVDLYDRKDIIPFDKIEAFLKNTL